MFVTHRGDEVPSTLSLRHDEETQQQTRQSHTGRNDVTEPFIHLPSQAVRRRNLPHQLWFEKLSPHGSGSC